MKVIFINTFHGYNRNRSVYYPGTNGFFTFGMGQFIAQEFSHRNYEVTFENWRTDLRIKSVMERQVDGLFCRIFPSKKIGIFKEFSWEFISAIKNEANKKDVIFHFMGTHQIIYHILAYIIRKNLIICTHLGGSNPLWNFHNKKSVRSLFYYLLEKYIFLKPYNHFITISKAELQYFKKVKKSTTHMPIFGISREMEFYIKDRANCRTKLGLPLDKKILLQVGRANENRGFDWIIDLVDYYKKVEDYYFVFVGINKEDDYYSELVKRSVFIKEYMNHAELVDYYNAADLLFYIPHGLMDLNFAGTSYVPLESLACGTPVVATTLHHFPASEINEVSRCPKSKEELIPSIEELLHLNVSRKKCREIVLKSFSWDNIINKYWYLYNRPIQEEK